MGKPVYEPTQAEIRCRCRQLQMGWSEATLAARHADDHERRDKYTVPVVSTLACREAMRAHKLEERAWFEY